MRRALGTLPWVEHASIKADVTTQEVRFKLTDKSAWNEDSVRAALKAENFAKMAVISTPQ